MQWRVCSLKIFSWCGVMRAAWGILEHSKAAGVRGFPARGALMSVPWVETWWRFRTEPMCCKHDYNGHVSHSSLVFPKDICLFILNKDTSRHLVKQDFSFSVTIWVGKRKWESEGYKILFTTYKWAESFTLMFPSSQYMERNNWIHKRISVR